MVRLFLNRMMRRLLAYIVAILCIIGCRTLEVNQKISDDRRLLNHTSPVNNDGKLIDVTISETVSSYRNSISQKGLYNATMHSETIYGDEKFRHSLKHFGVAHISDGIPLKYVHAALMLINKRIGEMKFFAAHGTHDKLQRDGEPSSDPEILDLFNKSFLKHIFEHLTGPRKDKYEQVLGQLTPRFPGDFCGKDRNWHIDYVDVYNAARKTELPVVPNFDALIAILLTDSHGEASGELCTFPSSHRSLSGYFVKNPGEFEKLHQLGGDAGYPRNTGHGNNKQDEVLGKDVYHCMGKAGDVFILNYMNAHYVTCNSSPYIRNNIYFRVWGNTFADHCREERNHGVDTRTGCGNRTSMLDPLVHWHL